MTSLDELRAIHHQRIEDERTAFERQRAAELAARYEAEQARISAEEATLREERDARVRIEEARVQAEREARLRMEAADAAERARLAIELEEQRRRDELELRRAEVAKQRPRWMIAVTAVAVCAGLGLAWFATERAREADAAAQQAAAADHERQVALADRQHARDELVKIQHGLDDLDATIGKAQQAVADAQNEADRKHALVVIQDAIRKKTELRDQLAEKRRKKDEEDRKKGKHFENCLDTALGCM